MLFMFGLKPWSSSVFSTHPSRVLSFHPSVSRAPRCLEDPAPRRGVLAKGADLLDGVEAFVVRSDAGDRHSFGREEVSLV